MSARRSGRGGSTGTSVSVAISAAELKELYQRTAGALARRPVYGRGGGASRVRLLDGLACQVDHAGRTEVVDLPANEGGSGTGPHPEELMRTSLGAALAQGYRLWAARLDVPVGAIELEIVCEYDTRGQLGISDDVAVGWQRLRVGVTIVSDAPEAEVRRVVEIANRRSSMLANLSAAVEQSHRLTVLRPPQP